MSEFGELSRPRVTGTALQAERKRLTVFFENFCAIRRLNMRNYGTARVSELWFVSEKKWPR